MATILLVEDQLIFRENLAEALEDHGYAVVRASNGAEAQKCIDTYLIDLFILDVALPGMNGLELLKIMRSRPALRRIPAMFLTAYPRQDVLEEASKMGVGDFLVKSDISLKDLLERIERGLSSGYESSTNNASGSSSKQETTPSRRHFRPALRRWRPQPVRPQIKELFALTAHEPSTRQILSYLMIDPDSTKWLRKILSKGALDPEPIELLVKSVDPQSCLRLLLMRAVVEGAMRSMEPFTDLRRLWNRSLTTALLAEELAPVTAFASPSEAFLAGMCLEVPWVFAIQALETEYGEVKAEAWEEGIPIRQHLAHAFGTDPANLALETLRGLEVPDSVWKAVVDLLGRRGDAQIWEPSVGGRVLDIVSELAHLTEPAWHPCTTVRSIHRDEAKWLRQPEGIPHTLELVHARSVEILGLGALPEALGNSDTRSIPIANTDRKLLLHRAMDVFVPDPFEAVLRSIGEVEVTSRIEDFQDRQDVVRVAVAEPGTRTWDRLVETTRRVVIFHSSLLPRQAKMGPPCRNGIPRDLDEIGTSPSTQGLNSSESIVGFYLNRL